ncbi:hypothetical protein BsWGS_02099 [Bradybaena similaris]
MEMTTHQILAVYILLTTLPIITGVPTRNILQRDTRFSLNKRPKYMDTRRDLDILKDLILLSFQELSNDESLEPASTSEDESFAAAEKRERYMGICMRKQYNHFIPFPCLRSG